MQQQAVITAADVAARQERPVWRQFSAESQCHGKRPFTTKKLAKQAATLGEQAVGRLHPFRCPHCGQWHLGHKPASGAGGGGSVAEP